MTLSKETTVGKKRVVVKPKEIADAVKLRIGQKIGISVDGDKIVVEPVRNVIWLAIYGEKIGRIEAEELGGVGVSRRNIVICDILLDISFLLPILGFEISEEIMKVYPRLP